MGPKFSLPHNKKDFPIVTLLKDVEYAIQIQPERVDKDNLRGNCTNVLTNFYHKVNNSTEHTNLNSVFSKTKRFLKDHEEIIVTKADKGNSTVLINHNEYKQKMLGLLNDETTYKKSNKDPTNIIQTKNNIYAKKLKEKNYIDQSTYKNIVTYDAVPPKIYGLPKIHKKDRPLRPIVSCINSPTFQLSKYITSVLSNLNSSLKYNLKNSFELVEKIKEIKVPDNYMLISLDVTSLFTNVSKELVIKIINKNWNAITNYTDINLNTFIELITFLFDSSYFTFEGQIYYQTFGCAMGNPCSPILANIVMNELLLDTIHKLPFTLPFMFCYVDDLLTAIKVDSVELVLNTFNNFSPHLQFTVEKEQDKSIPFLDVILTRTNEGTLMTDWYRKPTNSGRIINYLSQHTLQQKIATLKSLKHRALKLSDQCFHSKNLKIIQTIAKNNNYPTSIVNNILFCQTQETSNTVDTRNKKFFKVPNINGLNQNLKRIFKDTDTKPAFYSLKTVNTLFTQLKDKIPKLEKSNVIYKINCLGCSGCYIGQTKQKLKNRINNHKNDCKISNIEKENKTALATHCFSTGHCFDFSSVEILDQEVNLSKRLFLEMFYIKKYKNSINLKTDTNNLNGIYNNLITTIIDNK